MTEQRILIISQPYPPDPAATGKYMEDVARALAAAGHEVDVFASRERLDRPSETYKSGLEGDVRVRRLRLTSFGKRNLPIRLLGALSFAIQSLIRGMAKKRFDCIFVSTAPPTGPIVARLLASVHRARMIYWIHDINPDQAVALGIMGSGHPLVKLSRALNKWVLARADRIIVLDETMRDRIVANGARPSSTRVLPPWPHDDILAPFPRSQDTFRSDSGFQGSFLIMYSGNMGISHPLDTLLEAASDLLTNPKIKFAIVGQGANKASVQAHVHERGLSNVTLLPYQPAGNLSESLSAADLHVVITNDDLVGIVHPCKVYSSIAVERPILSIGPPQCPVSTLVTTHGLGWAVATGDSRGVQVAIKCAMQEPAALRSRRRRRIGRIRSSTLNKNHLCKTLCDEIVPPTRQLPTRPQQRGQVVR